jgi:hypothetical protein
MGWCNFDLIHLLVPTSWYNSLLRDGDERRLSVHQIQVDILHQNKS